MTPYFTVCYNRFSRIAHFKARIVFNSYDEMSEECRKIIIDERISDQEDSCFTYTYHSKFDYSLFLGDLIALDAPPMLEKLLANVGDIAHNFIDTKLKIAKDACIEYISYRNFSKDFLDVFTNSKSITVNQRLCEISGNRYYPLKIDSDQKNIYYCYTSSEIVDVVFSSIHFALENGYKFSECAHCGRWFFKDGSRAGSRKKYCNRQSTFKGYEHLPCEQAVRNISQELQREKKRIYNSIVREHLSTEKCVYDFLDKCAEYMSKIKECASVQNLSDYWNYLLSYRGRANYGDDK